MVPDPAEAEFARDDMMLVKGKAKAYFFVEDHIGRPVMLLEQEDTGSDGDYFDDGGGNYSYFVAVYDPFGKIHDDFDSTGIDVGNPNENGIVWSVPFRFPGQYQDSSSTLYNEIYYNWHRFYMPTTGRYNRADPLRDIFLNALRFFNDNPIKVTKIISLTSVEYNYAYASNNPLLNIDPYGLNAYQIPCKEWAVSHLWGKFDAVSFRLVPQAA